MNPLDDRLDKLFSIAGADTCDGNLQVPSGFAERVVKKWLETACPRPSNGASWDRVARVGLAFAGVVMLASIALNHRIWLHSDVPEQIAAESVIWLALPK
ncbi:MAG: hypothetical protein N3G20_01995 [Verrucomicrobiae bacterium]|nr:hypothetical protein [Verrucomicrobiae bacterium]